MNVIPHVVQAVGEPVVDFVPLHSQRHLEAVTGDPVDVVLRVEEVADAQRAFHLQPGEAAQLRVGIAQPAVAEELVAVQAAYRGVHRDARRIEDRLDFAQRPAGFAGGIEVVLRVVRVPRHKVVVVEAGGFEIAFFGSPRDQPGDFDRTDPVEHRPAERVRHRVADAPEGHRTQRHTGFVVFHFHFLRVGFLIVLPISI